MSQPRGPKKVLFIGAGPCLIGQGREFESCSFQVLSVLREKGIQTITVNDDPTSVLTDPDLASQIYIEPLTTEVIEKIFATERPDGLLQVLGNQNTLNLAIFFERDGIFDRYGIQVLGSSPESLMKTEDRELLSATLKSIPVRVPKGRPATTVEDSLRAAKDLTYPVILRPVFALKGIGGFIAYNLEETKEFASRALKLSPVGDITVEKALLGWKELEFEVLRDTSGKTLALAAFENLDPLGIHTGDSLSVYPFQTIPRKVITDLKRLSRDIVGALGLVGCTNIQYGIHPDRQESVVIDVSPGVARGSVLLSSATGLRLAEIATRLALGDQLDDLFGPNDQSRLEDLDKAESFLALKVPCFPSHGLLGSDLVLNASMKSVGSSLSYGSSFAEVFMKGSSPLKNGGRPFPQRTDLREAIHHIAIPTPQRMLYVQEAFRQGMAIEEVHELTRIDRFYLKHIRELTTQESKIQQAMEQGIDRGQEKQIASSLLRAKTQGFYDSAIASLLKTLTESISKTRQRAGIVPHPKFLNLMVKEKASPVRAYLSYGGKQAPSLMKEKGKARLLILGGGSSDPTHSSAVDDSCVAALRAVREEDHVAILLDNCPEALRCFDGLYDRAYVEVLNEETLAHILSIEEPDGVITQFGGEQSIMLSSFIERVGFKILGTPASSIQRMRDLDLSARLLDKIGLRSPLTKLITNAEEVLLKSRTMEFPLIIAGESEAGTTQSKILYDEDGVAQFMASGITVSSTSPVVLTKFSEDAIRLEVNALSDETDVFVGPIMEHIEGTAVNPTDSAWVLPSLTIDSEIMETIKTQTARMAEELRIVGFLNVHYVLKDQELGVLEIHPRACQSVAFASRALGIPLAKVAAKLLLGRKLREFGLDRGVEPSSIAVKEAALPFDRFPGIDPVLGPQPKSTGQVIGIGETFGSAFAKSQTSIGLPLPSAGKVFISVRNRDKRAIVFIAAKLIDLGFSLIATDGTARILSRHGLEVNSVHKIAEGRPDVVDLIKNGEIQLIINTPRGERPRKDLMEIRSQAVASKVPCFTTISGASAAVFGIQDLKRKTHQTRTVQAYYRPERDA
jgi:carbamoyl-phosphate synthase large subunit